MINRKFKLTKIQNYVLKNRMKILIKNIWTFKNILTDYEYINVY